MVDSTKRAPTDSAASIDIFAAGLGAVISVILLALVEGRTLWLFSVLVSGAMMLMMRKAATPDSRAAVPSNRPVASGPRFPKDLAGVGRP